MSAHKDRGSAHRPDDELTRRYHEANVQDMSRPGAQVRLRVQEHARAVLEARQQSNAKPPITSHEAANQPRWKISMLASIALAALTGLLVLQFDRGTPEEKDIAFGQPGTNTPAPAANPAPAAIPTPAPATPPTPTAKAPQDRPTTAAQKPEPASEQQQSRKAASTDAEPAAASAQGSANRNRDASDRREAGAAAPSAALTPGPSAFPASPPPGAVTTAPAPPPTAMPAPPASPRVMVPPAPAPAAAAAPPSPSLQKSEGRAEQRAMPTARTLADAPSSLLQAARSGSAADIARLVQQGAPLNGTDEAGRTPLMLAVINGHEAAARQLLSLGANRALVDREGLTALDHARRLGFTAIAALLEPVR